MAKALDDCIYCSPFLSVLSLDELIERPDEQGRAFDIPDPQPTSEERLDRMRGFGALHGALEALPPRQRLVIQALYFVGYSVTQTARLLRISAAAVVKLRTKALNRLFALLIPKRDLLFT
jgi:RNA polymerase sigma factor (sigma-70 family)